MTILKVVSLTVTLALKTSVILKMLYLFSEGECSFYTVTLILGSYVCVGSTLKKTRSPEDWMPRPPERYAL